ncbi:alpha/beta hydrolase fold-domain-containing protein [Xylogone sp. PMI_703]|nr:alpha/beta hydrolase fold-domain-containing protein [Xylogone sp. PMI_703]
MMKSGLPLTEGQRASISPEAAVFLGKVRSVPLANFLAPYLTTPARVLNFRKQLEKNIPLEQSIIAKFGLQIKEVKIAGVTVVIIEPPNIKPEYASKICINIHGGGFVLGKAADRTSLILAGELGIRVYTIEYTLSPEVQYPVARDECLNVYRQLVKEFNPQDIFLASSSSGGQLTLSMLLMAQKEKLPMPAAQYLCTPAADLTGAGDSLVTNAARDIMPGSFLIGMVEQNYCPPGIDRKDPLFSPLYATYNSDFPPTVISVGTRDLLLSPGVQLYWKLREAGVEVELLVSEGMWHGFNWELDIPESIRTRKVVKEFLFKHASV